MLFSIASFKDNLTNSIKKNVTITPAQVISLRIYILYLILQWHIATFISFHATVIFEYNAMSSRDNFVKAIHCSVDSALKRILFAFKQRMKLKYSIAKYMPSILIT